MEPDHAAGRPVILIVEDHPATGKAVMALLKEQFPHHGLLIANSAESALDHCQGEAPDVVIMDISLPGMNGLEATRKIKMSNPRIQVVIHTNNDMQIFRDESHSVGAAAFISKRHTGTELVPALRRLLPSASRPDSPPGKQC